MVLRIKSVVKDRIFDYIVLINLIFLPVFLPIFLLVFLPIFLPVFLLIFLLIFLPIFLPGLLLAGLCIYLARSLAFLLSGSLGSSFLILLINVRINAFRKSLSLRTPKPGLKALISFDDVGFKTITGVSN